VRVAANYGSNGQMYLRADAAIMIHECADVDDRIFSDRYIAIDAGVG